MTEDLERLRDWIGNSETTHGLVAASNADILNATLDRDDPPFGDGDPIPPGWHWICFHEVVKLADVGPDGHLARGKFMPPVPLPRRMWAGSKLTFHQPLRVGQRIEKKSTITGVAPKTGRSGTLCFVDVRHEISGPDGLATVEEHTTVYRAAAETDAPAPRPLPAPAKARWHRDIHPGPVMLFRYSALTMNSHRIHYDRPYVTREEGYPGLLVHGPLITTLILDLFRRELPDATMKTFSVRAVSPLFDIHDFAVEGAPGTEPGHLLLWALNHEGGLAQSAEATYEG